MNPTMPCCAQGRNVLVEAHDEEARPVAVAANSVGNRPASAPVSRLGAQVIAPDAAAAHERCVVDAGANSGMDAGADADAAFVFSTTPDDFERLFAQWRTHGDPKVRDRLILMHRNLVAHLARRFSARGELFEDVIQYGLLGLINALDHFDPSRGVRFVTFATPNIVGEIRRYFRDKNAGVRVPRRLQELNVAINQKIEALTQELDRSPTYHEIGRALSIKVEEVAEALELGRILEPLSLDEPAIEDEDGTHLRDQVGGPDPDMEALGEHAILEAALDKLPQPQRRVLELAYFEGHSQAEIARRLSVSQMHVSRVQRRALSQLRVLMEEV